MKQCKTIDGLESVNKNSLSVVSFVKIRYNSFAFEIVFLIKLS